MTPPAAALLVAADAVVACPHATQCPGCDHVGVPYGAQLAAKTEAVVSALAPYPILRGTEVNAACGAATIAGYRTRAKWMAGRGGALGLFARGTHNVIDLPNCAVATEVVAATASAVRALVRGGSCPAVAASLRAIDVREIQGGPRRAAADEAESPDGGAQSLVTLVLVRERRPGKRELVEAARLLREAEPRIASIAINWAPAKSVQILGDETEHLSGPTEVLDRQGNVLVTATAGSFVQAHRGQAAAMAEALVERAARLGAKKPLRVLELFSGAAPLGLALARAGHAVTSVESFAPAAEGAKRAAKAQGLALTSLAEDATRATSRLAREKVAFDLVVVDPPRRGLSPALRTAIADLAPRAIAYLSCDPTTFARDLAHLAHLGFRAKSVEPWDFIPLSAHVETLAWLEPAAPPPLEVLARDGAAGVIDAPPHLAPRRTAERAARQLDRDRAGIVVKPLASAGKSLAEPVVGPVWPGASGALLVGVAQANGQVRVVAAVRGRPRSDLRGPWTSLDVQQTAGNRSRIALGAPIEALPRLGRALARAGHPVLGDPDDGPTARHLLEKHGVDRPLVHVVSLRTQGGADGGLTLEPSQDAIIPGDMSAALDRLELG